MAPSWEQIRLGDALRVRYGKALPPTLRAEGAPVPVVGSAGVMAQTNDALVAGPAIIIGRKGNVGAVHLCESGAWPTDTTYYVVPSDQFDARFLAYQLRSLELRQYNSSTAVPSLRRNDLEERRLVRPSFNEQRRIVEILEDHLSRLDAAEAELHRARNRAPLMQESFLVKHRSIRDADHRRLGELLAEPLVNGRSVPDGDGAPVLRLTCLRDGRVDLSQRKLGSWLASEAAAHLVTKGDLLVARGNGSLRLVGRVGLVGEAPLEPIAFPDTLIRVRARPEVMSSAFLCLIWNAVGVRRQIEGLARTTAGIYKINQKHLQEVTLPCPDITTQAAFVEETTSLLDSSSRIEAGLDMALARGTRLRRALLTAAFAGRLTGRRGDDEVVEEMASV